VEGRIDHLAVDAEGARLFAAAFGNNTLEVIDLRDGSRIRSVTGLREPQGVLYLPRLKKVYVTNARDGTVEVFDGDSLKLLSEVRFSGDADNIRSDQAAKIVYVGYGDGALGILEAAGDKRAGKIKLPGHPESFVLERSGDRIYVNVPSAGLVAAVDRRKKAVAEKILLTDFGSNFPMALNEANHRLFVGTRNPPRMLVLDTQSGRTVAVLKSDEDADDMFYDDRRRRIYVSCGEGNLDVFEQLDADHYVELAKIATAPGARTSLWVPELDRLYVAVPKHRSQEAAILVYEAGP
jgi:DNA-binding beta-propeller fold protein YncE